MAKPETEKGFIRIATGDNGNDLIYAIAKQKLSGSEFACLLVIIRKTYGWRKKIDWISLSQFEFFTQFTHKQVCRALNQLVDKNIVFRCSVPGKYAKYQFNKNFDKWQH